MMKIWCISDTHTKHRELTVPKGIDMVICAGDAGTTRSPALNDSEMKDFLTWFSDIDAKHRLYVPGNHDTAVEHYYINQHDWPKVTFLIDEAITIDTVKIYGSPYTPTFGTGWAYNRDRNLLGAHWNVVPDDTDILVTHGPPHGILDVTSGMHHGDIDLTACVKRVRPRYHIFGHFHNERGTINSMIYTEKGTTYVNASIVDLWHRVNNNGKIIGI